MSGAKEWVVVVGGCDSGCVGIAAVACVGSNGARRGDGYLVECLNVRRLLAPPCSCLQGLAATC